MSKPILLVEDNPHDQELALIALERANLATETVVVNDGVEALDYLLYRGAYASRLPGNPAVILLDLKMPRMDGIEVLQAVRADEQISQIPIVMLTSSNQETDLAKSYELGVNAFVVKPMDFQELVKAVSDIGAFWAVLNVPPGGSLKFPSGLQ